MAAISFFDQITQIIIFNNPSFYGKLIEPCPGIRHHVTDLKTAEDFYGGALGYELLEKTDGHLVYNTGEITLYINKDTKSIPFIPALEVSELDTAREHLKKSGCKIVREFPGDRSLYFSDPFGNIVDIVERQ